MMYTHEPRNECGEGNVKFRQIVAKSREGFVFSIDLQVQIHVPDTEAPKVISIVGSMKNLVNEVLQAAVGNHFRDNPADGELEESGDPALHHPAELIPVAGCYASRCCPGSAG